MYFISLVAASPRGKPEDHSRIFDLLTKEEMKDKNVTFLDVPGLKKACKGVQESANVYELVEQFLHENRDISLIIDECPFLSTHPSNILNESIGCSNNIPKV